MKASIFFAAAFTLFLAATAHAGDPAIGQTAFHIPDGESAQEVFDPAAAKIVLEVQFVDVPQGTKIAADWVAVKVVGAPENFKITSAELASTNTEGCSFSLSKPNAGWPVGDYRVDLSINGAPAKSASFKVAQ